jgi:hypothetical protein
VWPALGAALVALACLLASAHRLVVVIAPTGLEPRTVLDALRGERGVRLLSGLREVLATDDRFTWEREFFAAFDEPAGPRRDALVNEQLLEFEWRAERWARIPRVCASVATSAGLLFGSVALLQGLSIEGDADPGAAIHGALGAALGSLALGIAATAFCASVYVRARRVSRQRRAAVDELVERLERLPTDGAAP